MNIGDRVICDLDGKQYILEAIVSRQSLWPSETPKFVGNVVYLKDDLGATNSCFEWEISPLKTNEDNYET